MRRLKEAEEEAAALRKQLAEAKEKAQVTACIALDTFSATTAAACTAMV